MTGENKFLIGIGVATLIIVGAGVFFFSKKQPPQDATPSSFDKSLLTENAKHARGDVNAPVTIVEFGDFQCPSCQAAQPIVNSMLEKYSQNIYFVYRHYPLIVHKNAEAAAKAAEVAGEQGKFFEMHDKIFEGQKIWERSSKPNEYFDGYAKELGLDMKKLAVDVQSSEVNAVISADLKAVKALGGTGTPTFALNGKKIENPGNKVEEFEKLLDDALARAKN